VDNDEDPAGTTQSSVNFSGISRIRLDFSSDSVSRTSPTTLFDNALSFLLSDLSSIVFGFFGLVICVFFQISSFSNIEMESIGQESRSALLAVFSSGAVLLNGISKLDITSALSSKVLLEGVKTERTVMLSTNCLILGKEFEEVSWFLEAAVYASPAETAVLLVCNKELKWRPIALNGIVPLREEFSYDEIEGIDTPILNRFLNQDGNKETYLPTLQAIPGKVEFTYLSRNTQDSFLLPIT